MSRTIKQLLSFRRIGLSAFFFIFVSFLFLPLSSASITNYGKERTNKYSALMDNVAYVTLDREAFQETSPLFSKENIATFVGNVEFDEEGPILMVYSAFDSNRFGIPFLEKSFIALPESFLAEEDSFYAIGFEWSPLCSPFPVSSYKFGGRINSSLPHITPFDDAALVERVLIFVTKEDLFSSSNSVMCCFECDNPSQLSRFKSSDLGINIKKEYEEDVESYLKTIRAFSLAPALILLPIGAIIASFLSSSQTKNWAVQFLFTERRKDFLQECILFWFISFLAPSAIAVGIYVILCLLFGFSIYYPYMIFLAISSVLICSIGVAHDYFAAKKGCVLL